LGATQNASGGERHRVIRLASLQKSLRTWPILTGGDRGPGCQLADRVGSPGFSKTRLGNSFRVWNVALRGHGEKV
jgi:hypothetical protein